MILGILLVIWFGILTIISVFITASLGTASHFFHKPMLRVYVVFAFLTIILAISQAIIL